MEAKIPLLRAIAAGKFQAAVRLEPSLARVQAAGHHAPLYLRERLVTSHDQQGAATELPGARNFDISAGFARECLQGVPSLDALLKEFSKWAFTTSGGVGDQPEFAFNHIFGERSAAQDRYLDFEAIVFNAIGLDHTHLAEMHGRISQSMVVVDPVMPSTRRVDAIEKMTRRAYDTHASAVKSSIWAGLSSYPPFVSPEVYAALEGQRGTAIRNAQESVDNPERAAVMRALSQPGALQSIQAASSSSSFAGDGAGGGGPATKVAKSARFALPNFNDDAYVRKTHDGATLVWNARGGGVMAWDIAIVAAWQRAMGHKVGLDPTVNTIPRMDSLLSGAPTAPQRAAVAKGAAAARTAEPKGWLAMREQYEKPSFTLPVGN